MNPLKKSTKITLYTLLVYGILVATHLGEFWPFSIFPMFSQAGNPWTRAMAMDVTEVIDVEEIWLIDDVNELPGKNFVLRQYGIDQIDYANFVSKTRNWNDARLQGLRNMIGEQILETRSLMVYKVRGGLVGADSVGITATPFILLTPDSVFFNPHLPKTAYFSD